MKDNTLKKLVSEAYTEYVTEAEQEIPTAEIEARLIKLRDKLSWDAKKESLGDIGTDNVRMDIASVAQIIGVPLNRLMLHFLNTVKNSKTRSMVEYHLGHVYLMKY